MMISRNPITILLILVALLAFENAEKLSKILKTQCVVHNDAAIQNVSCCTRPINQSVTLVNIEGNLTQLVEKAWINIQVHKRSEEEFRPFLINVTEDYCALFTTHSRNQYVKMITSIYLPYTNMNHTCPYFGYVYIKDMPMDSRNTPSLWPAGEYRVDVTAIGGSGQIITLQFFIEIREV